MNTEDDVRILVVDDNRDEAESLGALLSMNGYTVRLAFDGETALALLSEFDPHCLMLDIGMPGMDGIELSRRARTELDDDFVIIAVTGQGSVDDAFSKAYEHIDHRLRKPIDPARLAALLPPRGPAAPAARSEDG